MKRDWDFIRELLTDVEEDKDLWDRAPKEPKLSNFSSTDEYQKAYDQYEIEEKQLFGHLQMLIETGYLTGCKVSIALSGQYLVNMHTPRLTMAGHDLLDTMRSQSIWSVVKETAKSKGVELTFEAIKIFATHAISKLV